jgi:esterase/lipase
MTAWMILALIGLGVIVVYAIHTYQFYRGLWKIHQELAHFSYVAEYDTYIDAEPQFYTAQAKQPYGVLLLHGFSLSAQAFSPLLEELKKENINYYAVTFTGYGMQSPRFLECVRYKDWLRDAIEAYDVLAQTVEKVHVVGASLGAALGVILSQYRNVDKLIQLGPAMHLERELRLWVWLADIPVISTVARWVHPFYTKKICRGDSTRLDLCSVQTAISTFHHSTFPLHVVKAVGKTLHHIDLNKSRFRKLYVFYGKHDQVVDITTYFKDLDKAHIPYISRCYENSAHILTLDYDSDQVTQDVIDILRNPDSKSTLAS